MCFEVLSPKNKLFELIFYKKIKKIFINYSISNCKHTKCTVSLPTPDVCSKIVHKTTSYLLCALRLLIIFDFSTHDIEKKKKRFSYSWCMLRSVCFYQSCSSELVKRKKKKDGKKKQLEANLAHTWEYEGQYFRNCRAWLAMGQC